MDQKPINIDAQYRSLLIIWFAILASVIMFFAATFILNRPSDSSDNHMLIILLTAIGTFLAVASFVPKRKLLQKAAEQQQLQPVTTAYVVSFALTEMCAMSGVLLFVLTSDRYYYLPFIISALFMFAHVPRRRHLVEASFRVQAGTNPLSS
jgi:hypothetical protein